MSVCGTLYIGSRPTGVERANGAVAVPLLYGPRGGHIGSTVIDLDDTKRAHSALSRIIIANEYATLDDLDLGDGHKIKSRPALPPHVVEAIEMLADFASKRERELHPEYEHHDALQASIAGAIEVQIVEPDYEQIEES